MFNPVLPAPLSPALIPAYFSALLLGLARCVIEFGPPIVPAPELHAHYAEDKATGGSGSKATVKLLESIEEGMRGCLIEAPSYEKLETIYMVMV